MSNARHTDFGGVVTASPGPSAGLRHLARVSADYSDRADAYAPLATAAAQAEAEYRTAKAKAILREKAAADGKLSIAEAEARADADDHIAGLLMARLTSRAVADSHLEKLRQLRSQVDVGRSFTAAERAADAATAPFHP
jgi:hypothetical protein